MLALAQDPDGYPHAHAAGDDRIIGGPRTRTKYGYDAAGNTTSYSGFTFTYNDAGRMTGVSGAATTSYSHNALGQRVKKTSGGVTTYFVYDEAGHLIGEYDGSGALIQETIWLEDTPIATLRPNGGSVSIFYVHADHLNTPRRISRPSDNAIVWRWDSDPFGTDAANQDPDGDTNLFAYNLRFPGQYFDAETGLSYNYFRDGYDSAVGRYIQSDPIGLYGGINTYAYADLNPGSLTDPLGLQSTALCANPLNAPACAAAGVGVQTGARSGIGTAAAAAAAAAVKSSTSCCTEYKLVYEPNPKHRAQRYFRGGVPVARAPTNGQMTLETSVPTGSSSGRRVGYDVAFKELVVFPLTRTDEVNCIKYCHGWVADYFDDIYGRDDILRAIRAAGYPMP